MKKSLYEELRAYGKSDIYPFHMPGHKRNSVIDFLPADIDITEVEGFDNLHCPDGVLKEAQERAAAFYSSNRTWYLVNGSTSGILTAVSAVSSNGGGKLLIARNCHKSVYHAAFLNRMEISYLYPERYNSRGMSFWGSIPPQQVREALDKDSSVRAVVITSPTYDGVVSDIGAIAEICHENKVPLIVDEAHGAHFVLYEKYGANLNIKSALSMGADVVINSLHKTLPSMTQTALLHCQGELVSEKKLNQYSQIYQSSSPSYVMLAGMDSCIRFLQNNAQEYLGVFLKNLEEFYLKTKSLHHLRCVPGVNNDFGYSGHGFQNSQRENEESLSEKKVFGKDFSKILIFCDGLKEKNAEIKLDGLWLYNTLLNKYHLQMEMYAANYVLALTTIMDSRDGFKRLYEALEEIDDGLTESGCESFFEDFFQDTPDVACSVFEAENKLTMRVPIAESVGKISGEYMYLYPPGSPVIVPGERVSKNFVNQFEIYKRHNYNIQGLIDKNLEYIEILVEEI